VTDWTELPEVCRQAMQAAAEKPGRYGGRYVARRYNRREDRTEFLVLEDDDPILYQDDETLDILAQVTPTKVLGVGHMRDFLAEDGKVYFPEEAG
jgi:hypothetical protein